MYFIKTALSLLGAATLVSPATAENSMDEQHVQTSIATNEKKQVEMFSNSRIENNRSLAKSSTFNMWRFQTTLEGTDNHICLDAFRFIKPDTTMAIPTSVTSTQSDRMYSQLHLEKVFNVNNNMGGNNRDHWCGFGFSDIVITFASAEWFTDYKLWPHLNYCSNDPQKWNILAKNTVDATWVHIADEDHNCVSSTLPKNTFNQFSTGIPPTAGGGGDPHFYAFGGNFFTWQGHCDLVLLKVPSTNSSKTSLEIHIRTRKIRKWSAIDTIALKVGQTVLEIGSNDGKLLLDGIAVKSSQKNPLIQTDTLVNVESVVKVASSVHRRTITYDFTFDKNKTMRVKVDLRTNMIYIKLSGDYPQEAKGLLGSPQSSGLFARGGSKVLKGGINMFAESWQVQGEDPKLFNFPREPVHPSKCLYALKNQATKQSRKLKEISKVSLHDAITACAVHKSAPLHQFCIDDVVTTGDLDSANDEFYE